MVVFGHGGLAECERRASGDVPGGAVTGGDGRYVENE